MDGVREISTYLEVAAEPGEVWAVLGDFASYVRWSPWLRSVRGPLASGAVLEVGFDLVGSSWTSRGVIVELDQERALSWRLRPSLPRLLEVEQGFVLDRLEPLAHRRGRPRTRVVHWLRVSGVLARPGLALLGAESSAGMRAFNEALAARCESEDERRA